MGIRHVSAAEQGEAALTVRVLNMCGAFGCGSAVPTTQYDVRLGSSFVALPRRKERIELIPISSSLCKPIQQVAGTGVS